jgi:hypothetical protein
MSRKQCKRRIYKLVNPIAYAIEGVAPPQGEKLRQLQMHELSAIEAFRTGTATVNDWSKVVGMMNLAENMAKAGIGPEVMQICDDLHSHLIAAAKRYEATGKMAITGPALQAMRDCYEYHDLQRTSVSLSEYEKHILDTANRIRSKAPEVTDVLEAA